MAPTPAVHPSGGPALRIGSLLFEGIDQIDLTGPFEVFSRLSGASCTLYGVSDAPVRDVGGLVLQPDATIAEAPQLDLLHLPGGSGHDALMEDEGVLEWIRQQAAGATCVFSVCTGAMLLGAAGLLIGRRATTHWASFDLLPFFGAVPVDERVVDDGRFVSTAGVTAGIDGALRVAARLRGDDEARAIQLWMQYAPEPPFDAGTPATAPERIVAASRAQFADVAAQRLVTARRASARLGIS